MSAGVGTQPVRPLRTSDPAPSRPSDTRGVPALVVPGPTRVAPHPRPTPRTPLNGRDWRDAAACRDVDPEVFYPLDYTPDALVRPARRVCAGCPVRAACLADVMATEEPARRWGVCGGTTPSERTALYRAGLTVADSMVGGGAA